MPRGVYNRKPREPKPEIKVDDPIAPQKGVSVNLKGIDFILESVGGDVVIKKGGEVIGKANNRPEADKIIHKFCYGW